MASDGQSHMLIPAAALKEWAAFILPALTRARLKSPGIQPAHTWVLKRRLETQHPCRACTRAFRHPDRKQLLGLDT